MIFRILLVTLMIISLMLFSLLFMGLVFIGASQLAMINGVLLLIIGLLSGAIIEAFYTGFTDKE